MICIKQQLETLGVRCSRVQDLTDMQFNSFLHSFECKRNPNLLAALRSARTCSDTCYYIVYCKEVPLLFFSLRAASLFYKPYRLSTKDKETAEALASAFYNLPADQRTYDVGRKVLSKLIPGADTFSDTEVRDTLAYYIQVLTCLEDKDVEENISLDVCDRVLPAVELVEFCSNSATIARELWMSFNIKAKLGVVCYWTFIAPIIIQVAKLIGCTHIMLYAADSSIVGSLVSYYSENLHFSKPVQLHTVKPSYDVRCVAMIQPYSTMVEGYCKFSRL